MRYVVEIQDHLTPYVKTWDGWKKDWERKQEEKLQSLHRKSQGMRNYVDTIKGQYMSSQKTIKKQMTNGWKKQEKKEANER